MKQSRHAKQRQGAAWNLGTGQRLAAEASEQRKKRIDPVCARPAPPLLKDVPRYISGLSKNSFSG
jgi:hypothetical protein